MDIGRPLEGRTVLITGGSRGLGAATARRVARWGATAIITYRRQREAAEEVAADCAAQGPPARIEQLDLTDEASVRRLFDRLDGTGIDVLVANAAATAFRPLVDLEPHHVDKTYAITVRHFLLMVKLGLPLMEPRGGRILAISGADTAGYIPGHGLLASAKAAMETMIRYLACELGPRGMTAVGVLPGFIDTDSIRMMAGPYHAKLVAAEERTHPLRKAATPDDASEAVALLCLPQARWLNGQIVPNDGGGLFASLGRFGQAWAMVDDDAALPQGDDVPMLG